ncbi:MAG: STAS domain-containing protein [Magnetovibrio sp.]|nr:STAS domain-containing protein [Magnetovibrio sp.]
MTAIPMRGCIDVNTAPALMRELMARLGAGGELRLDMSAVTWIDSAGLASLVQLLAEARRRGGDLILCSASDGVRRMLRLARLDALFPGAG